MSEPHSESAKWWSVYVHEDDPSYISIRREDHPGDTLLQTSEGEVDQARVAEFVAWVNELQKQSK